MKLFYIILGATPKGRNTEQHDVFFGIAEHFEDLIPEIKAFWSDTKIHVDAYQEVHFADGFKIHIVEKSDDKKQKEQLFFINLGGYKSGFFQEFHEQHLMVGENMGEVIKKVKQTEFYRTMGFDGAVSHVDDKHGVDIDDVYNVHDLLSEEFKSKYSIHLEKTAETIENPMKIGYLKIN